MKIVRCFSWILLSMFYRCHADESVDGMHYEKLQKFGSDNQILHILKINPQKIKPKLVPALGQREKVSSIAYRTDAIAAINGGNYRRGGAHNGNQVGLVKIEDRIIADPGFYRGCIGFTADGRKSIIGFCGLKWKIFVGKAEYCIEKVNQVRGADETILYDRSFGFTTQVYDDVVEVIVKNNHVVAINHTGGTRIPKNGFIISYSSKFFDSLMIRNNETVTLKKEIVSPGKTEIWQEMDYILGGAGLLVSDNEIVCDFENEFTNGISVAHMNDEIVADFHCAEQRFWLTALRHPRTAVGLLLDGSWVIVVVDGRSDESTGMCLYELAKFMKNALGCCAALNLGGGGCSTLCVQGKILNNPSGNSLTKIREERPVSEAIVFTDAA